MSKDFEKLDDGGYVFQSGSTSSGMEGRAGEKYKQYYGITLTPAIVEEIKAWASVLDAIKDGIPKPFDNSIIISKIRKLENQTGEDLSYLKKCCPPSAEVREAKEMKPFIFAILDRIVDVGGIEKYVSKYEQGSKKF